LKKKGKRRKSEVHLAVKKEMKSHADWRGLELSLASGFA
jgi:hypothetical protein